MVVPQVPVVQVEVVGHVVVPHVPVVHVEVEVGQVAQVVVEVVVASTRILAALEEAKRKAPRNTACNLTIRSFVLLMEF